jgi:dihydrofolate reductase
MNVRLAMVVAMARNGVIGSDNALPWRISDDLKWFKSVTLGKPMIMGRKTFESIGKALPGRDNIVVTRSPDFLAEGVFLARSLDGALRLARIAAVEGAADEISIIGGADIFSQLLRQTERIYLTRVDAEVEGDVVFPALDSGEWAETRMGGCPKNDRNEHACEFFILDRKGRIPAKEP